MDVRGEIHHSDDPSPEDVARLDGYRRAVEEIGNDEQRAQLEQRIARALAQSQAKRVRQIAFQCAGVGSGAVMRLAPTVVMPDAEISAGVEQVLLELWPDAAHEVPQNSEAVERLLREGLPSDRRA